jgi:branched-subunit amino acid aminotransferase/4-amino-4-deoxychorismate lyase
MTPKRDCLQSITIEVVERICRENEIPFYRRDISLAEAHDASEAFVCSTSGGVTLVSCLDGTNYTHELSSKIRTIFNGI